MTVRRLAARIMADPADERLRDKKAGPFMYGSGGRLMYGDTRLGVIVWHNADVLLHADLHPKWGGESVERGVTYALNALVDAAKEYNRRVTLINAEGWSIGQIGSTEHRRWRRKRASERNTGRLPRAATKRKSALYGSYDPEVGF